MKLRLIFSLNIPLIHGLLDCVPFCLKVQFDVTFPAVPCSVLTLDAMDISGEQHHDIVSTARSEIIPSVYTFRSISSHLLIIIPTFDLFLYL